MKLGYGGRIQLLAAVFGDYIEVEIPVVRMNAQQAIELSQALLVHAHLLQERENKPENRILPLSEEFSLSLSDSFGSEESQTSARQRADVIVSQCS